MLLKSFPSSATNGARATIELQIYRNGPQHGRGCPKSTSDAPQGAAARSPEAGSSEVLTHGPGKRLLSRPPALSLSVSLPYKVLLLSWHRLFGEQNNSPHAAGTPSCPARASLSYVTTSLDASSVLFFNLEREIRVFFRAGML